MDGFFSKLFSDPKKFKKNVKNHPTIAKFCMTFAKKASKTAKKCKNLQKTPFRPHKGRFFTI